MHISVFLYIYIYILLYLYIYRVLKLGRSRARKLGAFEGCTTHNCDKPGEVTGFRV